MGDLTFGIMRVVAESPFYKTVLRMAVNEFFDAEKCERETVEVLTRDQEFTATLFTLIPSISNAAFGVVGGVMRYMDTFTPETRASLMKSIFSEFDAKYAAETLNRLFDLSSPEIVSAVRGGMVEFIDTLDFGKLRKFVETSSHCGEEIAEILCKKVISDPVRIANLLAASPTAINSSLRCADLALAELDMPAETLASAVFSVVESTDARVCGRLTTRFAKLVNKLHEGNYILGKGEMKFEEIAENFASDFLEELDVEEVKKAITALCEDVEAVSKAISNAIWKNPIVAITALSAIPEIVNILLRSVNVVMSKLDEMPGDLVAQAFSSILSEIDVEEVGKIVTTFAKIVNSAVEEDEEIIKRFVRGILDSSDSEEVEKAVRNVVSSIVEVVLSRPEIVSAVLSPLLQSTLSTFVSAIRGRNNR